MRALLSLTLASTLVACVHAHEATYYRAWQGFAKEGPAPMLSSLPSFMSATIDLYAKNQALSNYFVIIPPANSPAFLPHELALVSLTTEADYRRIRATAEGEAYSAAHWDIFDRATSASAPMQNFGEAPLVSNTAYNVLGKPVDWSKGVSFAFVGLRKNKLSPSEFLNRLKKHVSEVAAYMEPMGLRGYIIIANDNYEVAYMNWESEEARLAIINSAGAQTIFADAGDMMDRSVGTLMEVYRPGDKIEAGKAYRAF